MSGRIKVDSIRIQTSSCIDCKASDEGIIIKLLGEKNGDILGGVPCQTNILDHKEGRDFAYGITIFNGRKNGTADEDEKNMMGSCYEVRKSLKNFSEVQGFRLARILTCLTAVGYLGMVLVPGTPTQWKELW